MNDFLLSSTGSGIKLRIKALIPFLIPIINNIGEALGINILPEQADAVVDALFLMVAVVMFAIGWARARWTAWGE